MMVEGVLKVAPVGVMIMVAILYFGLMLDLGLFEPLVRGLPGLVRGHPVRLCLISAALLMLVAFDGDGATTFLISATALLPARPTARVMTVLHADAGQIFRPLLPAMLAALLWVFCAGYWFGLRERRRLTIIREALTPVSVDSPPEARQSRLFWFNLLLTVALLVALLMGLWPLPILFMCAFPIALIANYRSLEEQRTRIEAHGRSIVTVTSMILAAGVFTGVLTGTGMIDAMAKATVSVMPDTLSGALAVVVALTSMPLSLVFP